MTCWHYVTVNTVTVDTLWFSWQYMTVDTKWQCWCYVSLLILCACWQYVTVLVLSDAVQTVSPVLSSCTQLGRKPDSKDAVDGVIELSKALGGVTIVRKGPEDIITDGSQSTWMSSSFLALSLFSALSHFSLSLIVLGGVIIIPNSSLCCPFSWWTLISFFNFLNF